MLGFRPIRVSQLLGRRRGRQDSGTGGAGRRGYRYELAVLHLELLVAMAVADDQLRPAEVDAVLGFIDRAALASADSARLERHARHVLQHPPRLEVLLARLEPVAQDRTLAARLVRDLAQVATADAHTDLRECRALDAACDALGIARMHLQSTQEQQTRASIRAARDRAALLGTQRRARAAVRDALDASYRQRGA